jgi:proteasome accessory factor B
MAALADQNRLMQNVIERVINLLIYLLESPVPVTADDVRFTVAGYGDQTDDAFHRMFERDKEVLRRLGVPLERQALDGFGVDFGYRVDPEKYALPDPGLTEEERFALSVAARMVRLGGGNAGLEGLNKLGGVERGVGLEPLGADLGAESEILGDLFRAVTERRTIRFRYKDDGRTLKPYGLAHRRGHWYLAGDGPDGPRVFRIDRMALLEVGEEPGSFAPPSDFDIRATMISQPWDLGSEPKLVAKVRFDPEVAWWAARTLGVGAIDGKPLEVDLPVSNHDAFVGWILSFGASAEVISPEEMRDEIRARVQAAVAGVG